MDKLCIFDFDNTLAPNGHIIYEMWNIIQKETNKKYFSNKEEFNKILLKYNGNWANIIKNEFGLKGNELRKSYKIGDKVLPILYNELSVPYNGVSEMLEKLLINGNQIAIATNNRISVIFDSVKKIIDKEIPIYDQVSHKFKPDPGMILSHINDFGFAKKDVFMVGDSLEDILAAENAEIKSILALYDSYLINQSHKLFINKPIDLIELIENY